VVFNFFPKGKSKIFTLKKEFKYRIAGEELFKFQKCNLLKISRLTENSIQKNKGNLEIRALFNDKKQLKIILLIKI